MSEVRLLAAIAVGIAALTPIAAVAAVDLSGYYAPLIHEDADERVPGPEPGDYTGLPINDAARTRADTWNASLQTMPERQCVPHSSAYGWRANGPAIRIWETRDPATQQVVKINTNIVWANREIWLDGRPHPPATQPHTWQGFSTGHWEGDVLVVHTTHLKPTHIRRNGVMITDRAILDERFFLHEGVLNHVTMVTDPVYLTEPLTRTNVFARRATANFGPYPCRPAVEIPRAAGIVPHNSFGDQQASLEYAAKYGLPLVAVRGGAETMLPEFMETLAAKVVPTAAASAPAGRNEQ